MNKILRKIGFLSILSISSLNAQVYLNENFDGAFTGSPAAPAGWTQTRIVVVGDGIPDAGTTGEKDWQQITNTGLATWTGTWTSATYPNAANTGSSVIAINDFDFGGTGSALGTRRMESPVINLAASTNPYVRFMLLSGTSTSFLNLRVVGSLDGGTTWSVISNVMPNADVLTFSPATPWQAVNVKVPASFKVASAKFGFELTNTFGGQNYFIDDFKVEEFTPATITSSASGAWSNPATWSGGVVPNANNNVVIAASHSVGIDVVAVRCQNLTVDGLLNHAATNNMLQVYENCTVSATGTLVSGSTTTGRKTYFGGNIVNNGLMNFYPGTSIAAHLVWAGFSGNYSGTGVFTNSRVPNISHIAPNGVSYSNPVNVTNFCGLYLGQVNGTNLTVGNPSVAAIFTTERYLGAYSTAPIYNNTNVNQRNLTYITPLTSVNSGLYMTYAPTTITPGEEVELISSNRWNTGNLVMNTHNNITLAYPLTVGTTTGTTQNITMTRGIINTTTTNLLILNPSATGAIGSAPSTVTNTGINAGTHGSFINGPLQIRFPATGTVIRNFPLGTGSAFHNNLPSANILRTVSLGGVTAWNSQTITATIESAPSGAVGPASLTAVFGSRAYRLNYNGGPALGSGNTINMRYNNSTFGGSDNLSGLQSEVRIVQAPALNGPWLEKSLAPVGGAMVPNTLYSVTSNTTSSGGSLSTDQYFAWATVGAVCSGVPTTPTITGAISSCGGAATTLTLTSPSSTLVGSSTQWASSTSSVGPFTNMGTSLTQNTGTLATTMYYIATASCAISGSAAVSSVYTLQLNPNPTVTAISSSSTYCNPSATPISFTASGANTYTWNPSAGLSSPNGANVTGTLSAATVFSVTGTNTLTGCTSANGTIAISVNPGIASTTITTTPTVLCSGNSSTLNVNFTNTLFSYCQPVMSTGTGSGDYIGGVTLGSITNTTTGLAAPFYTLYPQLGNTTTTLTAGSAYTIGLQAGTFSGQNIAVWIDYNNNGSLDDAGEKITEVNVGVYPALVTSSFTVPLSALNGTARLRVKDIWGASGVGQSACTNGTWGETEDYEITIVGGVTPPSSLFVWSPATALSSTTLQTTVANPTATTNYSVNITNVFGCTTQTNITLNVTPSPSITITGPTVACSGATVNLTASGASSYTWNTGATTTSIAVSPSVGTTYTASGTGTIGCVGSKTITVNAGANPTINITGSSTVCSANSTTLTANGASTYSWNTGATTASLVASPTVNTTYTATGTSSIGCNGMAMVTVTVNAIPVVNLVASSTTVCANGNTLTLFGSPAGGAYSGANVSGSAFTPGATAGSFTPVYSFTNTQGCSNTASVTINVLACSGINEKNAIVGLSVYPNPNNGVFVIDLNTNALKVITITDVTGRVVYSTSTFETKQAINLTSLTNGVYFAQISVDGKTNTFKLIKE